MQAVPGRTFRSVDAVLKWAFESEQRNGAKVANYAPTTAAATGDCGLTKLESKAQAACAVARINRFDQEHADLLLACYSWGEAGAKALERLCLRSGHVIDRGPAPLIEALVVRHCRQIRRVGSHPLKMLALVHGVPYGTARRREELVRAWLGRVWFEAEDTLWREWVKAGLIEA